MTRWRDETKYDAEIAAAHRAHPIIPVNVIKAVIATESGFRHDAYLEEANGDGSIGLMQIRRTTAGDVGYHGTKENLFIPAVNILYGTAFLAKLARQVLMIPTSSGPNYDYEAAVSAYNGGYRPHLGFGARLTVERKLCLRKDPKTGQCLRWFTAKPGEFGNQPHVDRFRDAWRYFGMGEQRQTQVGDVALLAAAILGATLLMK